MISKIPFDYITLTENNIRVFVNDGNNNKFLNISVYFIKDSWYIDISENGKELILGQIIHTWRDLFEILKIYYRDFPNLKLMAIPSNINGINKNFSALTSGITQEICLIGVDS